ncbi:L,D-transpeptidase catalytic domain [Aliiroseovarius sediminilitoris]|uniref:L,D-transpeptidase catalytic domain n=1 Tax=Aliiroseovarius sediminilitoris TaxID=1173584 RepID=A0A1I0MT60_9RHOB|nr:L,D-transpeptidase [Aliiroseovarius sediminilitoris]SEV91925.1 L,D-transpeptidase catalytic domain [Aliiroseovarius sediminilitoris]
MQKKPEAQLGRRAFLGGTIAVASGLATPALAQFENTTQGERDLTEVVKRNISSFRSLRWEPYFDNTRKGAILVDISSRCLHYWSEDQAIYRLFPTSVPMSEDLTRRGRTSIIRKVEGPSWAPTPAMRKRNPEWPSFVGPGPDNPLGTHALYLSWQYYRIHGTQDTRKIGRQSSNGCIGLYNEHIAELFGYAKNGTQVLLI